MTRPSEFLPPVVLDTIFAVRAPIVRLLNPARSYYLFKKNKRSIGPLSSRFGFDRGTPITRFYIEEFLTSQVDYIQGRVLEIHDAKYSKKYGKDNVKRADVLDIDTTNKNANIYGDLRNLKKVKSNTYDCLIITQTFGMIDDFEAAVKECHRILKPGGALLGTVASMGPMHNPLYSYWRFTKASVVFVFGKYFSDVFVKTYGNALSGQASWVGMAVEDLSKKELLQTDERYQVVIGFRSVK